MQAAVRCGADAIYLGSKDFSARAGAQNFDFDQLRQAAEYCHERDVKLHLALNTALYDDELSAAAKLIEHSAKIGVDALIVSDLGALSLVREICPSLSLHASTQMGIASLSGVLAARDLGFDRAVLARELSRKEICDIAKASPIETEVFVHGALCMSVSGQCYLSALLGGRSGNRGRCAQPCRLNFSVDKQNEYALSLKDNCLCEHIKELCSFNVTSLKIEGRMKRPEYVAAAVSLVKAAMQGEDYKEMLSLSQDIFSRSGFTDGYYRSEIGKKMFGFRSRDDVSKSANAIPALHELYRRENQRVAIDAKIKLSTKEPSFLVLCDKRGNSVKAQIEPAVISEKQTDEKTVLNQLSRLGSTPYFLNSLECEIENGAYVPVSALNLLRRTAVDELSLMRREPPKRQIFEPKALPQIAKEKSQQKIYARFETKEQFFENADVVDMAYIPVKVCLELLNNNELSPEHAAKIIAELDRAAFSNDEFTKSTLVKLKNAGIYRVCVQNIGQLYLSKEAGMQIYFGAFMNVYNSRAVKVLSDFKVESVVASFEIPVKKLENLVPFAKISALIYGYLPLMMTRACPVKSAAGCKSCNGGSYLTDRTGKRFRVACRGQVSEIYNTVPLSARIEKAEFDKPDFLLCYFTFESPKRCREVILSVKNRVSPDCPEGFTRGLYKSGVI